MTNPASIPPKRRGYRAAARIVLTAATAAAFVGAASVTASAAPGPTADGLTEANVEVGSSISLSGLTNSFTLSGIPGADVSGQRVTMNVATNNTAGYNVTVVADAPALLPADTTANTDSIPIGSLAVKETGSPDADFAPLSNTAPVQVHTQATRSVAGGDTIDNDFRIEIPFVNEDTYSVDLNYIATTL